MDVMLQTHGAKQVALVPPGLRNLVMDISREVLRHQPTNLYAFIADYMDAQLLIRESAKDAVAVTRMTEDKALLMIYLRELGIGLEEAMQAASRIQAAYRKYASRKTSTRKMGTDIAKYYSTDEATAHNMAKKIQMAYRIYAEKKRSAEPNRIHETDNATTSII